jgi:hypothetical protein
MYSPPQVVDLAPVAPLERSDRNREVVGDMAGAASAVFFGLGVYLRTPLFPEWVRAAFLFAFLAVSAFFVGQLAQALVRRPRALEISGTGMRLLYVRGISRDLNWIEVANEVQIEEVTVLAPRAGVRMGSRIRLAQPISHSFRVPNLALETIRSAATAAGLTEEVRTLTRPSASGWAALGIKVRFLTGAVPAKR